MREGGSLPATVGVSDSEFYVAKFIGSRHGSKALIAELITGEIVRTLGLNVPEIVLLELDENLGCSQGEPESQALLTLSIGLNPGLRLLPKAFAFEPLVPPPPHPLVATKIVWLDASVLSVDRTPRNVSILLWQKNQWPIHHGYALYFHHDWANYERSPFVVKDPVLLPYASELAQADQTAYARFNAEISRDIAAQISDVWLDDDKHFAKRAAQRGACFQILTQRLNESAILVQGHGMPLNAHLITRSCASFPTSNAKEQSTRAFSCIAPHATLSRLAFAVGRSTFARFRPRRRAWIDPTTTRFNSLDLRVWRNSLTIKWILALGEPNAQSLTSIRFVSPSESR